MLEIMMATMDGRISRIDQNLGSPCTLMRMPSPVWVLPGRGTRWSSSRTGPPARRAFIDWMNDYRGHLALEEGEVNEGVNKFWPVSQVYDPALLSFVSVTERIPINGRVVNVAIGQMC